MNRSIPLAGVGAAAVLYLASSPRRLSLPAALDAVRGPWAAGCCRPVKGGRGTRRYRSPGRSDLRVSPSDPSLAA